MVLFPVLIEFSVDRYIAARGWCERLTEHWSFEGFRSATEMEFSFETRDTLAAFQTTFGGLGEHAAGGDALAA